MADRIRITSDSEQNLRVNPDTGMVAAVDGMLAYAAGDINFGQNPNVVGSAYTNSRPTATTTTLYDIDSALDIVVIQNPPNEGVLTICLQDCSDDPESCSPDEICAPFDEDLVCVPDAPNPGGYGEDCTRIAMCDPGLVCIDAEFHAACDADACCTPYCVLDGRPCPDGMTCELFPESEIGLCRLP